MDDDAGALVPSWLAAARDERIAGELEAIYVLVADTTTAYRPTCVASGRCCNFRAWDHRLYVTGLEAAYAVARLGATLRSRALDAGAVRAAQDRGVCPLLGPDRLCGAHAVKPLGCRVYFCDPRAQAWQFALTERALGLVRALHDRHAIAYRYAEWLVLLSMFADPQAGGAPPGPSPSKP